MCLHMAHLLPLRHLGHLLSNSIVHHLLEGRRDLRGLLRRDLWLRLRLVGGRCAALLSLSTLQSVLPLMLLLRLRPPLCLLLLAQSCECPLLRRRTRLPHAAA